MGGFLGFLYRQTVFHPQPIPANISLEGSTALITGANIGLAFEAAFELASHRLSRLIIAVRDISKGENAKATILKTPPECNIEVWQIDYDSYESIIAFSKRAASLDRLDYVLLSAGVKHMRYETSHAGHETNVQINHLATSLLSLLLLPPLQRTATIVNKPSRLTIVSSEGHFWIPFKERTASNILERMDAKETFGPNMQRYYTTKLLNVLWTRELASRLQTKDVIINTLNPGFCHSGLHRHITESTAIFKIFLGLFGWTTKQSGYCLSDALIEHEDSHGQYISEQKITEILLTYLLLGKPSHFVTSAEGQAIQKKVWKETVDLLKREAPDADIKEIY